MMPGAAQEPDAGRVSLTEAQRLEWLRLIRSENVGPATFRTLVNHYGGARAALDALPHLSRRGGAKHPLHVCSVEEAEREIAAAARLGIRYVAPGEPGYPPLLRQIHAPPPLLGVKGDFGVMTRPAVAIVGARNASALGRRFTQILARGLGEAGFVVVSGLARGIDGAAHEAALATGTVAVLASGLDHVYPPEHEPLLRALLANGAAISEMPLGWEARGRDFPRRNRLISGMSLGVIVVEAAERSGSLITARYAVEQNREVFAVPGSPFDPRAKGTNALIRDSGAMLVTGPEDVIQTLKGQIELPLSRPHDVAEPDWPAGLSGAKAVEPEEEERSRVTAMLGVSPVEIDELIRQSGARPAAVHMLLLELELAGRIERHAGQRVSLMS